MTPRRLNRSSIMACSAVIITGMCSGRQPAITALTAMRSTVARPPRGGNSAINSPPPRPVWATNLRTKPSEGGTTGSPSVHPVSNINSMASATSVESMIPKTGLSCSAIGLARRECKSVLSECQTHPIRHKPDRTNQVEGFMICPRMPVITAGYWLAANTLALISLNDRLAACISSKLNLVRRCERAKIYP